LSPSLHPLPLPFFSATLKGKAEGKAGLGKEEREAAFALGQA